MPVMSDSSKRRYRQFRSEAGTRDVAADLAVEKPQADRRTHWRYLRQYAVWLKPHKAAIVLVFALALLAAMLSLVLPYATKWVIDGVLLNDGLDRAAQSSRLMAFGLAMIGLLLLQQAIDAVRSFRMTVLNSKVIFRLRQALYERILDMPLPKLSDLKVGGIVSRVSGDIDEVTGILQSAIITPGVAIIRTVLTVAVLLVISWKMAVVAVAFIPPIMLLNILWIRRVRPVYKSMRKDRQNIEARVVETFSGIRVVRSFRRQRREARDYAISHHTVIRKQILTNLLQMVVTVGWGFLIPGTSLLVIWYGGTQMLAGEVQIGEIMAFQMYLFMLLHPVSQIVHSYGDTQRALAAMERTFDLFEQPVDKPDRPGALDVRLPIRGLRFEGVGFEYVPDRPVLSDIDLAVEAGQTVALVGPSGSGKTTLTDLVARFIDPTAGRITLDGVDLRDLKLASFRRLLGVVQQEVFLFDGTVRENIAYGRRSATLDQVIAAARTANADEFITALPQGYDTLIGERGVKLSGGQRQRLSIARALLADPQILILDEATSNLDTESEQLIQASLVDLFANRTTFVIAHRLSTITHADLIVVLMAGRIVESGTHAELMAAGGPYSEMVSRQTRFYSDAVATLDWR